MNLVKWNPWREMDTFSDRVNRIFNGTLFPDTWLSDDTSLSEWRPVADITDHESKIVIRAELPGVDKKDIHVDLKDNILTLEGERSHEKETKEEKYYHKERVYGKFSRSFRLPDGLNPDNIKADYKDGVLTIELPKPEEKKPKKIAVH